MVVVMTGNSSLEVEDEIFEAIKQSTASFTSKSNQGLYVWEVRNFITLKNLLQKRNITGLAIKSGLFEIEDHKFRLVVYPRGNSQPPIHLSVFLEKENKEDSSTEDSCFSSFHFSVVKRGVNYSGRKGSGRKGSTSKGSANTRSPQSCYITKGLHGRISNAVQEAIHIPRNPGHGWAIQLDPSTVQPKLAQVAAVSLQACCRGYLARKRYSEKREASSAFSIQKYVRRWLLVDAYTKLRFSTLLIQSSIRGFLARQSFTQRNEHKAAMLIQMGRSAGFNLGGTYSLHRPQQHAPSVSSSGVPFSSVNNHDLLHLHSSDMFQSSHSSYHSQTSGPPGIGLRPLNSPNTVSGMGSYDQLIQQYQQHQNQSQFQLQQMPGLNQSHRDQGVKSMQSAQAAPDSFGLLGLFRMSDPDLTSPALGIDLTTLGLNLNSTENLHKTFGSPWSDDPAKGDPEFVVPQCYYAKQPPALSQSHFLKFPMDTLFYIFYSMPKDEAQLYAANELYNRGWFYHRELRQWLTRVPNMEPLVKTNTYERGSYICFDPNTWEKIRKDNFIVHYEMLEKRPNLPQH
ncbi:hypothetical protein Vadar_017302 [Vaccinium darrowii]|uniref:Uncharacterized protein n=1 Tax=Vaccinium darrowii TaxID=229202 RepID=A0ACB7YW78_9ERIC|nr:hypothetical protein Vadar_017302 [Vaccinium darrowii]